MVFSNPIVFEETIDGWKKVIQARRKESVKKTDTYLYTPDKKLKLR